MKLTSPGFSNHQALPGVYAFGAPDPVDHVRLAENRNPALCWDEVPIGTRSLVILCHDPDVPGKPDDVNQEDRQIPADLPRVDFYHWVLVDLPATTKSIKEGAFSDGVTPRGKAGPNGPDGTRQGLNNYTDWFAGDPDMEGKYFGYDGPCPPWNDSIVHHYVFTLFAIDIETCPVDGEFTGAEVLDQICPHTIEKTTLTGLYSLNPKVNADYSR